MAFLIPDNLKSRPDVPNVIRHVADAFLVGLDEDVTVWYEPLYDSSGQKPHFIVYIPNRGIAVLEVLDTKGSGLLGTIRGNIRITRDGNEVEIRNPLERADKLRDVLYQRVKAEPRLKDIDVPVSAGAIFPYITKDEAKDKELDKLIPANKSIYRETIDSARLGEGETNLIRSFIKMFDNKTEFETTSDIEILLRGIIQPETIIDSVSKRNDRIQLTIFRASEETGDIIRVMDRRQEAMAKSLGSGHRIVRGVAGSGKTLILTFRAKLLAQIFPLYKILVTCYNVTLAGQLQNLLNEYHNIDVINLDKIMWNVIREMGWKFPGFKDDDSGNKVAELAISALERGAGPRYEVVLLDEAQDFGNTALNFAKNLLKPGKDELLIVADAAQNIFRRKFSWKDIGIQAQGRTKILRTNYRNTKEILEFAMNFLLHNSDLHKDEVPDPDDETAIISPNQVVRSGPKPVVHLVNDVDKELEHVINTVKKWSELCTGKRIIAIAYPIAQSNGLNKADYICDMLSNEGIGFYRIGRSRDEKLGLSNATETVIVSPIFSLKGLEFPYVVLSGIWRDDFGIEENRKVAYVGMTRATDYLTICSTDDHPLVKSLIYAQDEQR